jgi:hypothetical protein
VIKGGEGGLTLLGLVSPLLLAMGRPNDVDRTEDSNARLSPPETYFEAWNERDMDRASAVFTDDVTYDDTAFAQPFRGKDSLKSHLQTCGEKFPSSFAFKIDRVFGRSVNIDTEERSTIAVQWHVEANGRPLAYARGSSFYTLSADGSKIQDGIDFVEAAGPIKPGLVRLYTETIIYSVQQEPMRLVAWIAWVVYVYVVFFSDGILPGADALQLEVRTWEEVRDLSVNFFFVAPLLELSVASDSIHPMLEAVFNMLLAWAALFLGFYSDERREYKQNLVPFLPTVVGMQFLTSAFLLPYLATRSRDCVPIDQVVPAEELDPPRSLAVFAEGPWLGSAMAAVGLESLYWFLFARADTYGTDFAERWTSFVGLLSIDRLGSSFLVDLVVFALFQRCFIDDDLRRRTTSKTDSVVPSPLLSLLGKYVPFFGLAAYLVLRPPLAESATQE